MFAYFCGEGRGNGARDVAVLADNKIMVKEQNNENVLGIVLAGGRGERLFPLTNDRAKPAVPFGGKYRIIDFVLSSQSVIDDLVDGAITEP